MALDAQKAGLFVDDGAICNEVNEQMTDDAFNEPSAKSKGLCWKRKEDSHKVYYGI